MLSIFHMQQRFTRVTQPATAWTKFNYCAIPMHFAFPLHNYIPYPFYVMQLTELSIGLVTFYPTVPLKEGLCLAYICLDVSMFRHNSLPVNRKLNRTNQILRVIRFTTKKSCCWRYIN